MGRYGGQLGSPNYGTQLPQQCWEIIRTCGNLLLAIQRASKSDDLPAINSCTNATAHISAENPSIGGGACLCDTKRSF